jgi:hypothetical protein
MRTMRRRRGGSSGGVGVGRSCAAGDGLRETSLAVYGGVEERLLLVAGEARRGGGDVTPAFLSLNKSPNKSCVFSKPTRRAQLPFKP